MTKRYVEPKHRAPLNGREEYGTSNEATALFGEIQRMAASVGGARLHARTFARSGRGFGQVDELLEELAQAGLVGLTTPPPAATHHARGDFGRAGDHGHGATLIEITPGNEDVDLIGGYWQRWSL